MTIPLQVSSQLISDKSTLRPLTTPELGGVGSRFILLPTTRSITVLSEHSGQRVAIILANDSGLPIIQCMTILSRPIQSGAAASAVNEAIKTSMQQPRKNAMNGNAAATENWLLLGCSDGTIRRVTLSLESLKVSSTSATCSGLKVAGPCLLPEQIYKVANDAKILLLSAVPLSATGRNNSTNDDSSIHILMQRKDDVKRVQLCKLAVSLLDHLAVDGNATDQVIDMAESLVCLDEFERLVETVAPDDSTDRKSHKKDKKSKKSKKSKKEKKPRQDVALEIVSRDVVPFVMAAAHVSESLLIVLASRTCLHIYCDDPRAAIIDGQTKCVDMDLNKGRNSMTAMAMSSTHVAVGYRSGEIHLLDSLLVLTQKYLVGGGDKTHHPSQTVLTRKFHWHAHPVACLEFSNSNNFLLSGGEESVMVTWQVAGGTDRPTQVLPRVALGGIHNIVETNGRAVLVCTDNSVQLLQLVDQSCIWRHQGLAMAPNGGPLSRPFLRHASMDVFQIVGPSLAPGYMHWYDIRQQQVVKSLEVALFNRISRAEPGETPMPSPMITHTAYSKTGDVMVTCERVPTENTAIGYVETVGGDGFTVGFVTTLRFWSENANGNGQSYELSAAMAFPHGTINRVSSLCVSNDGKFVCTLSNDENAFRIWHQAMSDDEMTGTNPRVEWACQYRVTTPAGYANSPVNMHAVAFSSDASVIAIGYGRNIALWDREEMTLLTSVPHCAGDDQHSIEFVKILDAKASLDMLLTATSSSVSLQSVFGSNGPVRSEWMYSFQKSSNALEVTNVEYIRAHNMVAVCMFDENQRRSRVLLIDVVTGEGSVLVNDINGKIISIVAKEQRRSGSSWNKSAAMQNTPLLFGLTVGGVLVALNSELDGIEHAGLIADSYTPNTAPTMPLLATFRDRAVKRTASVALDMLSIKPSKRVKSVAEDDESDEATLLSTSYARSFLARHLQR
ncbi:hypothetical protein MPSEU_000196600 [Mayamaea pseudoterrestris]|nr:hypothetical protein MPSEU_000196600 [Mayamaea pseudoterrestris]